MQIDIQKIIEAARAGGKIVNQYFGQALEAEEKTNAGDLRTKADIESEQAIIVSLQRSFPACNIYAEESGTTDNGSEYTFVIDPLDGTSNFVLGIPDFAISIGLLKGDDAIAGVIYNPILDQMFTAEQGKGAFLNGRPIHVNGEQDITRAAVSYVCGYNTANDYTEQTVKKLHEAGIKRLLDHWAPTYDYCLLAAGRIEGVISKDGDFEDYVAAKVIVSEAGAIIRGFQNGKVDGRTPDFVVASSQEIADQLIAIA